MSTDGMMSAGLAAQQYQTAMMGQSGGKSPFLAAIVGKGGDINLQGPFNLGMSPHKGNILATEGGVTACVLPGGKAGPVLSLLKQMKSDGLAVNSEKNISGLSHHPVDQAVVSNAPTGYVSGGHAIT